MRIVFLCMLITFSLSSQTEQKNIFGEWLFEGAEMFGTFYNMNNWNQERLTLSEDYSFEHQFNTYINHQQISQTVSGKWIISKDSSKIILFNDQNRYQKDISVKTIYNEFPIFFSNKNYLVLTDQYKKSDFQKRYKKQNVTSSFDDDYAEYLAEQERKNRIIDAQHYYLIAGSDSLTKKYRSAYFTFVSQTDSYSDKYIQRTKSSQGKILKITDTSIWVQPYLIHEKNFTKNNSVQRQLELFSGKKATIEIMKQDIQKIHTPVSTIGMKTSFYFAAASALTTLIIAPIVGLVSNDADKTRNYLITAGSGIVGFGIGTGSFYLFRSFEKKFRGKGRNGIDLLPVYQNKKSGI